MEPFIGQAMSSLMQVMTRRQGQLQQPQQPAEQPQQPGEQQPPAPNPGVRTATKEEIKEVFDD